MPTWPGTLPQKPSSRGYREVPPSNTMRTQMDQGPAKIRRRTTANVRPLDCTFELTLAEVAILETFYTTTLKSGSLAYDWDHPRTDVAGTWRFKKEPVYSSPGGDLWEARCSLELLP